MKIYGEHTILMPNKHIETEPMRYWIRVRNKKLPGLWAVVQELDNYLVIYNFGTRRRGKIKLDTGTWRSKEADPPCNLVVKDGQS